MPTSSVAAAFYYAFACHFNTFMAVLGVIAAVDSVQII